MWKDQKAFWILSLLLPMIPDLDAIGWHLGIPYGSLFGHRGFTHSILFALILSFISSFLLSAHGLKGRAKLTLFFFLITLSHGILDGFTSGGLGIAYFSPFYLKRYFFPFRPIKVAPLTLDVLFSKRGVVVLKSEILWVWIPALSLALFFSLFFTLISYIRKRKHHK